MGGWIDGRKGKPGKPWTVDGWMDGWMGGRKEAKAGLRIAYSNQKDENYE